MLLEHPHSGGESLVILIGGLIICFVVYMAIFYPWRGPPLKPGERPENPDFGPGTG